MYKPRFPLALALTMLATMVAWVGVSALPASAAIVTKQTIDGFGSGSTGSSATRSWTYGSGNQDAGTGTTTLVVPNQNGGSAALVLDYTMTTPINMTAGGASALVFQHPNVTTTGDPGREGIGWTVTVVDTSLNTSSTGGNARVGQSQSVMPLVASGGVGFSGTANMSQIKTMQFAFYAISNTPGVTNTMTLDALETQGEGVLTPQNITFTSQPPANPTIGGTYTVGATGGASGNPVTFVTNTDVCAVEGNAVAFVGAGTCVISAHQSGNAQYADASSQMQTMQVAKANQSVLVTNGLPTTGKVAQTIALNVKGNSSGVQVSYATGGSAPANACSLTGNVVTFDHVGTCRIDYTGGGDSNYNNVPPGTLVAVIGKGDQGTVFTTPLLAGKVGDTITLGARGTDTRASVTTGYSLDSTLTTNDACTVTAAGVAKYLHAGTCAVQAIGPGNADYNDGAPATSQMTVGKASQTTNITTPLTAGVVLQSRNVVAKGTKSDVPAQWTVAPATTNGACTVTTGGAVKFEHAGTCVLEATGGGNGDYLPGNPATTSATVGKASQALTVLTSLGGGAVDRVQTVAARGASGVAATVGLSGLTTNNACTVTPAGEVTFRHVGVCAVTFTGAGNDDYNNATPITQQVQVGQATQLTTISRPLTGGAVGNTSTVQAAGVKSGVAATWTVGGATTNGACTVTSAGFVRFAHVGTCALEARGGANDDYTTGEVTTSIAGVYKGSQDLTVTRPPVSGKVGQSQSLEAFGAKSNVAATWWVNLSTSNGACTVADNRVQFKHVGECTLFTTDTGNVDYYDAPSSYHLVLVTKGDQAFDITEMPASGPVGSSVQVAAEGAESGVAATITVEEATTTNSACTLSGGVVNYEHAGTCGLLITGGGDADWNAPTNRSISFSVTKATQTMTVVSDLANGVVDDTFTVSGQGAKSGEAATLSVAPSTTNGACEVSGSTVTYRHVGTCVVTLTGAGSADYRDATPATLITTVSQAPQSVAFTSEVPGAPVYPTTTYDVTTTSGGGSGNPVVVGTTTGSVCAATDGQVRFLKAGTCTISADQTGNTDYQAATQALQQVTVVTIGSTVAVVADTTAPVFGQSVRPIATVTPVLGDADGSVQFSLDGSPLGSPVAVGAGGTATGPAIGSVSVGTHQLGALFIPSDPEVYSAGQQGEGPVAVGSAESRTTVSVSRTTITAKVSAVEPGAGTPSGTVEFGVDGSAVGTAPLVDGTATLSYRVPAGSTRAVSARYSGGDEFTASSDSTARRDPAITASLTSGARKTKAGWYRKPVTVTFRCTPAGSPLTGACPTPVTLKANKAAQSLTRTITADNGGIATVAVSGINLDKAKPRITFKGLPTSVTGATPTVRCKATDALSGVKSCRVRVKRTAQKVTWRATAIDKAGNKRVASRTRKVATAPAKAGIFTLSGVPTRGGVPQVRQGKSYTMVVISKQRPRYVNAAVSPQQPSGLSTEFIRAGTVNGIPRWVLGVTFARGMADRGDWNIGVRTGTRTVVLKVHVTR